MFKYFMFALHLYTVNSGVLCSMLAAATGPLLLIFKERGRRTNSIKIVSVLQRLHGEIGRTNSDVQKRDGQTNRQTNKQTDKKTLNVFGHPSGMEEEGAEGSLLHAKFHPHRCNDKGVGPQNSNFYSDLTEMWNINAPQGRIPCAIFTIICKSLYLISGCVGC